MPSIEMFRQMSHRKNKYLFNSKELQDAQLGGVNLDWYDYGARFYTSIRSPWTNFLMGYAVVSPKHFRR